MAIAIKSIPVLKDQSAKVFNENIEISLSIKSTVDFSKESEVFLKILAKAKI